MEVNTHVVGDVSVVEVIGDIDGASAPAAQGKILPLVQPGCRMVMDMSRVGYMSSAGLRMMLLLFRRVTGAGGKLIMSGLSDDIRDTMSLTGFLDFFAVCDTVDAGLAELKA